MHSSGKLPFSGAPPDDRNLPDMHLALYNDVVVFDHATKLAYVISWVHLEEHPDVEAAYQVCRCIGTPVLRATLNARQQGAISICHARSRCSATSVAQLCRKLVPLALHMESLETAQLSSTESLG